MTELTLSPSNRYGAGRRRSPGAFAAALAINGGVFALVLAMPGVVPPILLDPPLPTHWIYTPPPPEPQPEPITKHEPLPTQKPVSQHDPIRPYVPDPVVPLGSGSEAIAGGVPSLGNVGGVTPLDPPVAPPHQAIFRPATQDPRYAMAFHPDYPPALRRDGLEGSVTVRVDIDESGRVTAVELIKATNRAFFEETRDQALRFWRFRPATSDGVAVTSQQTLTVHFRLDE